MAQLKHKSIGHVVETDLPAEIVTLRSQGYRDVPAPKPAEAVKADAPKSSK